MQKRTSETFFKRILTIILIITFLVIIINLLLTIPQTIQKENLNKNIQNNLTALKEVGIDLEIETNTSYKFNKKVADQELDILKQIDNSINSIINNEIKALDIEISFLEKDLEDLKTHIEGLGIKDIPIIEILQIPDGTTKSQVLKIKHQNYLSLENSIQSIINSIKAFGDEKVINKEFFNPLWSLKKSEIESKVKTMPIEEKIGQLFIWTINGSSFSNAEKQQFKKTPPSGVILMGYNISSESQLKNLTKDIQLTNTSIPLFITTDQEGGVVKRVGWDYTAGQKQWSSLTNEEICSLAKTRSDLLIKSGINVNFSPVVDLSYSGSGFINNRTIDSNSAVVSEKSNQYVKCSQEKGIITTLKHFPGHGSTAVDSHYYLPIINKSKEDWLSSDAIPFINNFESKFIMVGHLKFSSIDNNNPATTSSILLNDILRKELGYKGIVITDDMNQLHRSTGISKKDAIIKSLNAGVDIILYVGLPDSPEKIIQIVKDGIINGEISQDLIDEKVTRILLTKRAIK